MSSVVNKGGKRFAPKIRKRRVVSSAPAVSTPTISSEKSHDTQNSGIDQNFDDRNDEREEQEGLNIDEEDPLSQSALEKDLGPSRTSTQLHGAAATSTTQHRRSSRLDSLSGSKPSFKNGYTGWNQSSNGGGTETRRRLSSISGPSMRKKSLAMSTTDNDSSLQTTKRRRMSSRSSLNQKKVTAQRISIVSRMSSPDAQSLTAKPAGDSDFTNDIFQRTDDLYERYTITNLKMIPKQIADEDSSKYLIDEENFTMGDLCKPTLPIGETSENFQRAKQASKLKVQKRKKRRELRELARKEFKSLSELVTEEVEKLKEERKKAAQELFETEVPEEKPHQGIQLKLSADGTLAVDEESTLVDRHKNASLENYSKEKIQNNPFENLYNSATYGRQQFTDPWTTEEMIKFYQVLSMWGTDFNLISQLFPYRTRRQIKAKFVNEEKKHPVMVELALRSKLPPNFEQYCLDTRKAIGTVDDFNKKLEQLQIEHEEHLKQIEAEIQSAREHDIQQQTVKENERAQKGKTSNRNDQLKEYRKSEIVLGSIDDLKKKKMEDIEAE